MMNKDLADPFYPWQHHVWEALHGMREKLPHAILFHGQTGIGKRDFAAAYAQSLLCEKPLTQGMACRTCDSCGWFSQYSHPDYRRVRPEIMEDAESSSVVEDATNSPGEATKSSKAPSKEIRIEQIRALAGFMNVSTHRNCKRVVLLYPAESLNNSSANALLKTLEEPPPNTVIILVSNQVDRLLPTILSRCRKMAMPMPDRQQSLAWLAAQNIVDPDVWLDEQGGAPLAAAAQYEVGNSQELNDFLQMLANPNTDTALAVAEKMHKTALATLVSWLQRWIYDINFYKFSGRVRYYPRFRPQIEVLANRASAAALITGTATVSQRRAIADHPLSPKLFIEDMLLDYIDIFS